MSVRLRQVLMGPATAMLYLSCCDVAHGCDSVVSPLSVELAQHMPDADYPSVVVGIALENFSVDASDQAAMRALLLPAAGGRDSDPAKVAANLTASLRAMCRAFDRNGAGHTPDSREAPAPGTAAGDARAEEAGSVQARSDAARRGSSRSIRGEDAAKLAERVACTAYSINPAGKHDERLKAQCDPLYQKELRDEKEMIRAHVVDGIMQVARARAPQGTPINEKEVRREAEAVAEKAVAERIDHYWIPPIAESRDQIERNLYLAHEAYLELKANARDDANYNAELADAEFGLEQAQREAMLVLPAYGLYVGPTFLQKPNGGFQEAFELSARFDTGRFDYPTCSGWNFSCGGVDRPRTPGGWFRGFFEANYRSSDITDGEENDEGTDPDGYFARDDGRIRANAGVQWHFLNRYTDALGVAAGIGFTSPIGDNDGNVDNDYERGGARFFAGLHSHVNYRLGIGELFLGWANDEYWDVECPEPVAPALRPAYCGDFSKRYVAEGSFTLANESASDWSLIGKVSADIPTDSKGRSDVAVSVLLRRDLDGFLKGFKTDK